MEMTDTVDWEPGASQWSAILSALHRRNVALGEDSTLWPIYGPLIQSLNENRSYIVGQIGQSLDGRIATANGKSHYINGLAARVHLHRLRALVDGIVVGVGTVLADDPLLTVRHTEGENPARIVIDPDNQIPDTAQCFRGDGIRRIVIQSGPYTRPAGVECVQITPGSSGVPPHEIIAALADLGLSRLLIEGGAHTVSKFLAEECLDRLHILMGPLILGSGKMGLQLPEISALSAALRPHISSYALPEGDVLYDCKIDAG